MVIARQGPGGIFADVLAGGQNQSPVNVLAAYLNCDRSALCRELSRMQQDGLITLQRGGFTVHDRRRLTERNDNYEQT